MYLTFCFKKNDTAQWVSDWTRKYCREIDLNFQSFIFPKSALTALHCEI